MAFGSTRHPGPTCRDDLTKGAARAVRVRFRLTIVGQGNEDTNTMQKPDAMTIQLWVRDKTDLSGGDFSETQLKNAHLVNGRFAKCDFSRADLSSTDLALADFTDAVLRETNFRSAVLVDTIFKGADLTGADLEWADIETADFTDCVGIIDAGTDDRNYRFIGVKPLLVKGGGFTMVKAGCRWFTIDEAMQHWRMRENEDALARVRLIASKV